MNRMVQSIFLCLALFSLPSVAVGESWRLLGEDDIYAVYIDQTSITMISNTNSKIWVKVVPKGRKFIESVLQFRKKLGLPTKGYESFAYLMESVEIDCALGKHRILETVDFGSNDHKISSSFPIFDWTNTQPNTPYDSLAKLICRQHSFADDWWEGYHDHQSDKEEGN